MKAGFGRVMGRFERTNVRVTPAHARADKYTPPLSPQLGWTSPRAAA